MTSKDFIKTFILSLISDEEILKEIKSILRTCILESLDEIQRKKDTSRLLSITDLAVLLSVSKATIHNWSRKGIIQKIKIPGSGKTFFKYSEVDMIMNVMKTFKNKNRI